jgi:hypothetical protein
VIARWGVPPVFAATAAAAGVLTLVLLAWRRPRITHGEREPFLPALVAGSRYVRHEPVVRRILLRFATFMAPACAVWALLPLIASRQLGLDAAGYGLVFAGLGLGAVAGALGLGRITQHLSSNAVLALAALAFALAFGALAVAPNLWVAAPLLVVCGFGWTATVSTVISELQLFLPGWVRARAIAIYLMVFLGTQAVFSPIWGQVTQHLGLDVAMLAVAALVGLSAIGGLALPVPDSQHLDRSALSYWIPPPVAVERQPGTGPIVVSIEYQVAADQEAQFLAAMETMRRSRLRSGASRWGLYRVGEHPDIFTEQFQVPTWREHQLQHDGRLTAEDQAIEDAAFAHILGTPRTRHLIPPATARDSPPHRPPDNSEPVVAYPMTRLDCAPRRRCRSRHLRISYSTRRICSRSRRAVPPCHDARRAVSPVPANAPAGGGPVANLCASSATHLLASYTSPARPGQRTVDHRTPGTDLCTPQRPNVEANPTLFAAQQG